MEGTVESLSPSEFLLMKRLSLTSVFERSDLDAEHQKRVQIYKAQVKGSASFQPKLRYLNYRPQNVVLATLICLTS